MTVAEFIKELMEYPWDAEINFQLDTSFDWFLDGVEPNAEVVTVDFNNSIDYDEMKDSKPSAYAPHGEVTVKFTY